MTSKTPSRRLTDILRSNSKETLLRNAAELARVSTSLPAEKLQTRFLRNMHLISPKSLRLLCDDAVLSRWFAFAVYKPPFCPMRRAEANKNYHHVSVESFVEAALRSRTVQPVLQRELQPEEVKVRVLNDVDMYASGPVVVTLADRHTFSTSLQSVTMRYDVLVAGHMPLKEPCSVEADHLFAQLRRDSNTEDICSYPDTTARATRLPAEAAPSSCVCTYQVRRNAYYSVHPVSLLEFTITAPPTPLPPRLEAFVCDHLGTFVLGDSDTPATTRRTKRTAKTPSTASESTDRAQAAAKASRSVVAMHGDCDFPRVFTHLREVSIQTDVADVAGGFAAKKPIEFHCRKCFEPILQRERIYSLKGRRIGLLDGSWTPEAEFL
ncbi:hypothetical protein C3747_192g53 [Trypanosoma cruzi]|uniref:Uncharacterized protein n=2 Tax=Trypanosoma cruzi TaxID=5693 RepID=Q4DDM0_TRYCC|nr:hypothetical protein, conserved [Trypanosoma cruzi]EAN90626.1 hypothetical protein, conserved [Trypanosoma cruzi]PWV02085.1 hypothetical protein C3747_192g53 [Trypanosoma cruzi]RNC44002.1 hypothetical protein TcCL_NonESM06302 [Trypanosoma cruzi]|eukprot:XP_812477.1 hypothetical protein [Trypanosoma cruzi strain CL Brener]